MPNDVTAPAAGVGYLEHSLNGVWGAWFFFPSICWLAYRDVCENTAMLWGAYSPFPSSFLPPKEQCRTHKCLMASPCSSSRPGDRKTQQHSKDQYPLRCLEVRELCSGVHWFSFPAPSSEVPVNTCPWDRCQWTCSLTTLNQRESSALIPAGKQTASR